MFAAAAAPSLWLILPFAILLGLIAVGPLAFPHWWHRRYPLVALTLGALVVGYYCFGIGDTHRVLHTGQEFISFIALIGSLFVVSGGIHIGVKGEATPLGNVIFLLIGALLANVIGTTGASMLLIRPWIRMNKYRITAHHIVFFIFIVSNIGGALTPIGDPPLLLGYLKGVPFWWVAEHCWPHWAAALIMLLGAFFMVDYRNYFKAPKTVRSTHAEGAETWRFEGGFNVLFLAVILGSVFIQRPAFLREALMIGAAAASWFATSKKIHQANDFTFGPVKEVAILFVGIFATMMPALDWLQQNASTFLRNPSPALFYWGTGIFSAILDNAPTYLGFLSASFGSLISPESLTQAQALLQAGGSSPETLSLATESVRNAVATAKQIFPAAIASGALTNEQLSVAFLVGNHGPSLYLVAISVGSVFFGAATYIGNGPNFMVKAIADQNKVETPSFFGYITRFALPVLLPVLIVIWLLFIRG